MSNRNNRINLVRLTGTGEIVIDCHPNRENTTHPCRFPYGAGPDLVLRAAHQELIQFKRQERYRETDGEGLNKQILLLL